MKGKLLLLGSASLLISLAVSLPASLLLPFIPANSSVQLSGVTGSIWKGNATHISAQQILLGQLSWDIHPLALFTATLQSSFQISSDDLKIEGVVNAYPDSTLKLEDVEADVNAGWLRTFKKIPAKLAGNFHINIVDTVLSQDDIPLINGKVEWERGEIISPFPVSAGNYLIKLTTDNKKQKGLLSSSDAPFDIKGKLSLDEKWQYQAKLKIKANETAPKILASGLQSLGKKDPNGFVDVDQKGNLRSLF